MDTAFKNRVIEVFEDLSRLTFQTSTEHGFEDEYNFGEKTALMHGELSEGLEWHRIGNPPSNHIPAFSGIEEEFADAIIRILNDVARHKYRIGEAILAKMDFNARRPFRHGGKKC